jgi:hypothetical protein
MQSLKLQTFKNIQTGNVAEMLIDDGVCVYYKEICAQGVVKAGQNQDEMFWAFWTPETGIAVLMASECPCLDDALSDLEDVMGAELSPMPWYSETTGL